MVNSLNCFQVFYLLINKIYCITSNIVPCCRILHIPIRSILIFPVIITNIIYYSSLFSCWGSNFSFLESIAANLRSICICCCMWVSTPCYRFITTSNRISCCINQLNWQTSPSILPGNREHRKAIRLKFRFLNFILCGSLNFCSSLLCHINNRLHITSFILYKMHHCNRKLLCICGFCILILQRYLLISFWTECWCLCALFDFLRNWWCLIIHGNFNASVIWLNFISLIVLEINIICKKTCNCIIPFFSFCMKLGFYFWILSIVFFNRCYDQFRIFRKNILICSCCHNYIPYRLGISNRTFLREIIRHFLFRRLLITRLNHLNHIPSYVSFRSLVRNSVPGCPVFCCNSFQNGKLCTCFHSCNYIRIFWWTDTKIYIISKSIRTYPAFFILKFSAVCLKFYTVFRQSVNCL